MWLAILGPLLVHDGETQVDVPPGRLRVLLAALLLRAGEPVAIDALAEMVWDGSPPSGAAVTLRSHVVRLRRVLGPRAGARLVTRYPGYLLQAGEDEVDALRFRRLCRDGGGALREEAWARADRLLDEALGLWRGVPLADVACESLRRDEGQDLEELRLQAEEWRADAALHLGRHAELVPRVQSLATQHPLRERFHGQLMLALYRCGRQAEALAAYQRARDVLVAELGVEPEPGLRNLHQRILSADPALAGTERPAEAEPQRAVPRELPPAVSGFTGRSTELAALTELLDQPREQAPGAVVISAIGGTAGVGKTALAVRWSHQVAGRFPDGQLYVNLRGYDPGPPVRSGDALARFLRSLGVPGQDIPPEEDQRAARYRSLLAGQQVLVVLDNAGSADQVRPLLPGAPACTVLVTSRDALAGLVATDGVARLDLDVLAPAEAVALLRTLIGARAAAEPDAADELAAQCCRLPLALRIAAELAASRPAMPLAGLVGELADLRTRLDRLDIGGDPGTEVRAVFSWSCRHLDADAARAFRLAGLHPGPDLEPYAVAALADETVPRARWALDVLARAHLIQPAAQGRYGLHDLLRGYARELSATLDGGEEEQAALTRLFDYYLHAAATAMDTLFPAERHRRPEIAPSATPTLPVTDPTAARTWLDEHRATLVAVTAYTAEHGWPGHTTQLALTLFRYLDSGGHYPEAIAVHTCAHDAARRAGDRAAEANVLTNLGTTDARTGHYRQATSHHQQALALFRETGDQPGQARSLHNLGTVELLQAHPERADGYFQQALPRYREAGDRTGEARTMNNLGTVDGLQGRYQEAAGHHQEALALSRAIGDGVTEGQALTNLGCTYQEMRRYPLADDYQRQALALARETGDRTCQAHALVNLGHSSVQQGQYQQATEYHQQALDLFRAMGNRSGEAEALNGLGDTLLSTGRPGHARAQHTAALGLADEAGDQAQQARAHNGLAHAYQADGDSVQARRHWQEALARYAAIGAPEARETRARLATTADSGGKDDR